MIAFNTPTAIDLSKLRYVWYGPLANMVMVPRYDTTMLNVAWYGPFNYAPSYIQPHRGLMFF